MIVKYIFDRIVSLIGLLVLWPLLLVVALLIRYKMPDGPVLFKQQRVGRHGRLFTLYKFRTMTVNHGGSSVSVAGESRITPLGCTLRRYNIDELPELWNVLRGDMSFVGPRPDVPGYADQLQGKDRDILRLRPGITGPASLKYRNEEYLISDYIRTHRGHNGMTDEELAVWYNDNVIYPDKVYLNRDYLLHQSLMVDLHLIFRTIFYVD
ncbi:MAG: sugar transferase [Bacteroidaceae bacterium]|nr:sugar transferase [Bacteroidaceae bacterium]